MNINENRIESLEEAVEYVIDGMIEGQGFEALATQEMLCLAEEAERYVNTYLLKEDFPYNPFQDVDELEKTIGVSYTVLISAVATAILRWLESHAAEYIPAADALRAIEARYYEVSEWLREGETFQEAWACCRRGDWLLWLAANLGVESRPLTSAKAACAALAKDMMSSESLRALEVARQFSLGRATREELAAAAASAALVPGLTDTYGAAYAAYAAADPAASGRAAAEAAIAAYSAAQPSEADAARRESLKASADICREMLTEEVFKKVLHRCRTIRML